MNQGGQNCPTPLKTLKMHIFQWNLPKMKYSTWSFAISQKKLFSLSMTSLWRHNDVFRAHFESPVISSMCIGLISNFVSMNTKVQKIVPEIFLKIWRSDVIWRHMTSKCIFLHTFGIFSYRMWVNLKICENESPTDNEKNEGLTDLLRNLVCYLCSS